MIDPEVVHWEVIDPASEDMVPLTVQFPVMYTSENTFDSDGADMF
jgi:hypothetical protein